MWSTLQFMWYLRFEAICAIYVIESVLCLCSQEFEFETTNCWIIAVLCKASSNRYM